MPTLYDEVQYPNLPLSQTHPDRLATIATLFGMEPALPEQCRVMEIGCGSGENLIPIAFHHPGSEFFGIDAAQVAVEAAQREIAELGLTNIRIEHGDIMDALPATGEFDFIVAHGFYSWVPEPVRDRLMAIVEGTLAPEGVAYVSYNALPGGRIRQMFREMMQFHIDEASDFDARICEARDSIRWFMASHTGDAGLLPAQAESIATRDAACLFHDELGDVYHPVYLREFLAHAARFGLQFLSEANYYDMQAGSLPPDVVAQVERASGGDRIGRDQYFDFLKCRMFRQTLLCRAGTSVAPAPLAGRVARLFAACSATPQSERPDLRPGVAESFRGERGSGVTTAQPFSKAVMQLLCESWPETLGFASLLESASRLAPGRDATAENLGEVLLAIYSAGVIELHVEPARCVARVSERPRAGDLARWQARRGRLIATARHSTVEAADEKIRQLIGLLDGTRDCPALARELSGDAGRPSMELVRAIRERLEALARAGMLTA